MATATRIRVETPALRWAFMATLRRCITWQLGVVVAFAGLLLFADLHHPYWPDEVHSWLIAQNTTPWGLFADVLRYEGNPGLWHLLLWAPAHLGAPMFTMSALSAAAGAAAVLLILYRSPFPVWARALLPFSYFVLFQYSVVARPYCLLALATCLIALAWPRRITRPYRLVAAMALLSFIAIDGALFAAGLAAVQAYEVRRDWQRLAAGDRRRQIRAGLLVLSVFALIAAIVAPPADAAFNLSQHGSVVAAVESVGQLIGGGIAGVWLTAPVLAVPMYYLYRRRQLRLFVIPSVLVVGFSIAKVGQPWDQGFIFFPWLLAMWTAASESPAALRRTLFARLGVVALGVVLGLQAYWSVAAVVSSTGLAYSALPVTAAYLKAQGLTRGVVYGYGYHVFTLNAFFGRNIFANMNGGGAPDYYPWTTEQASQETAASIDAGIPDVAVIDVTRVTGRPQTLVVPLPGYTRIAYFEGFLIWKDGVYERDDILIAVRDGFRPQTAAGGTCPAYCGPPTGTKPLSGDT